MSWPARPSPIRALRDRLPAEMRLLRGLVGVIGGLVVLGSVFVVLLGGNWQLGYAHDRVLASIFLLLVPAALGIAAPLWYWMGRPLYHWVGRPGDVLDSLEAVQFLPGLAGSVLGILLVLPVSATSRFAVQVLAPFGLAIGLASPLWFWILRPIVGLRRIPDDLPEPLEALPGARLLLPAGALLVVGVAVTAAIALPVVGVGASVSADGLDVAITETRTVTQVTGVETGYAHGSDAWRLLLVHVTVENRGGTPRPLPGTSVGDIVVIAPECGAQNFGEPSNNCNQVYVDGDFTANGVEYANYDARQASTGGTIDPGDRVTGWLVFRIESPSDGAPGIEPMVVVDDVGRWTLARGWPPS